LLGPAFVASAAPAWTGHVPVAQLPPETAAAIAWATPLAFNMGVYNLVLAIGLLWVAIAGSRVAASLGVFRHMHLRLDNEPRHLLER
jgi:hypothetical protein